MHSGESTLQPQNRPATRGARKVKVALLAAGAAVLGGGIWLSNAQPQDRFAGTQFPPVDEDAPGRVQITHGDSLTRHVEEESQVRLNYILAPWRTVLEEVAEATGTHLVASEFPAGRFSRQDWNLYDRDRALAILNRELNESGFELLLQDNLLLLRRQVVEARIDYLRPQVDATAETVAPAVALQQQSSGYTHQFDSILPTQPRQAGHGGVIRDPFVQQVAYADDSPSVSGAAVPQEREPDVSSSYQPRHRTSLDLARALYDTYRARAELVDAGPLGFPAFQVFEAAEGDDAELADGIHPMQSPERTAWLTVEIDSDGNQLHMHGQERTLNGLDQLLRILDRAQVPGEPQPRVILGDENLVRIGEQLAPEIQRLRQHRELQALTEPQAQTQPDVDPFAANPIFAYQDDGAQDETPPSDLDQMIEQGGQFDPNNPPVINGDAQEPAEMLAPIDQLLGDVRIEVINDLNLMIIYGNARDVEAVMRVIRTIDELAVGASPQINLHFLNYVNCEALAELLNEVYSGVSEVTQPTGQIQPSITIIPVVTPNAILILAPRSHVDAVVELATLLDREGDPQMEVQVFPLRNAVVSQVVTMLETFYAERGGLAPRILAVADVRTNNLIVQARPRDLAEVAEIILRIDRDESPAVAQMRVIRLQNSLADEVAEFLNTTFQSILNPSSQTGADGGFQAGGQAAQELRDSKAMVLEFLTREGNAERLLRSGLLSDVRFNADIRTNNLLVTAPEASMPLIEEIVRTLDMPSAAVADIKVFQLRNADAISAAELLDALFATDDQAAEDQIQFQLPGSVDASSSLIPMRFTVDSRTNSVVAIGGADAMQVVEAILIRLDSSELRDRERRVLKLRNSPAESVADAINLYLDSQREIAQLSPDVFSIRELLEREVIAVPDPVTNNILIEASPRYIEEIVNMVLQLDAEPAQVMIQTLLVEVELDDSDEFGVELGFQDSLLFDRSVLDPPLTIQETVTLPNGTQTTSQRIISQTATPGFLFNNQQLGNNIGIHPASVGSQGLSNFALGRVNGDLGFGGLVLSASSESVNVLIRALSAHRNIRVHSRPQVSALDNVPAQIQVGQIVPVVNGVSFNNNQTIPIVEQQDAGIILTVQPRISPEGDVVMQFTAEKSQFQTDGVPLFTDAATGNVITSPIKDIITATTTIKVPDGQTVVVGGMITQSDLTDERKVPWLGDIPLIGTAFRYDAVNHRRTELLIFLTPRIIGDCHDFEVIKEVEAGRIQFFVDQAEAIHGPIYSSPHSEFFHEGPVIEETPWNPPTLEPAPQPMPVPFPEPTEGEAFNIPTIPTTVVPNGALEIPRAQTTPQDVQHARGQ